MEVKQKEKHVVLSEDDRVRVALVDGPLCACEAARIEGAGAVISFEGLVRPTQDAADITGLLYEVYEPMTQNMLLELALQIHNEFDLLAVHVTHSKGFVPSYDCSFRLMVASKHRKEGLDAMDRFIIRMKQEVPIWKHIRLLKQEDQA